MKIKQEENVYQVRLLDEKIAYSNKKQMPHIDEVLSEPPCFVCDRLGFVCDVNGCDKLTTWANGGAICGT